jgi:hypothetical protein
MSFVGIERPKDLPVFAENIPDELKAMDRWVVWRWEFKESKGGGKYDKPPRHPSGRLAATNNPKTWVSFDDAYSAYLLDEWSGLGMVLPPGIVGVDIDDCIEADGRKTNEATLALAKMATYAEVSPSGRGLKFLCGGHVSDKMPTVCHERGLELYEGGKSPRYFTITGRTVDERHKIITGQREGIFFLQTLLADPIEDIFRPQEDRTNHDVPLALECLKNLKPGRADTYDTWIQVGMALKSVDPSHDMLNRFIEWSSQSGSFVSADDCEFHWNSFRRSSGRMIGLGSLKRLAKADGWRPECYRTYALPASELCRKEIIREYIVEDFMVRNEPMVIGGASKSLKTTVALELAVSIATGTSFLGHFEVKAPRRVLMVSGESGESTIQDALRLIANRKCLEFDELKDLEISTHLPKLDDVHQVGDLIQDLKERAIEVVIIDPLYRSLRVGDGASNVYAMGERLEQIAEQIQRAGLTTILLHHFRKQGRTHSEPPDLEDLSQSGVAEFARQFLLLKRREVYGRDGNHTLWFHWGGSAGHQGSMVLAARTGTRKDGLKWECELIDEDAYLKELEEKKETEKEDSLADLEQKIFDVLREFPGLTIHPLREKVGAKLKRVNEALARLGTVIEARETKVGRTRRKEYFLNEGAISNEVAELK